MKSVQLKGHRYGVLYNLINNIFTMVLALLAAAEVEGKYSDGMKE